MSFGINTFYGCDKINIFYCGDYESWTLISNYNSININKVWFYNETSCFHSQEEHYWMYDENNNISNISVINWDNIKNPTCTEEGIKQGYCIHCNELIQINIPKTSHLFDNDMICINCGCLCSISLDIDSYVVKYTSGAVIFDGGNWINGVWANYMIVDAEGVIAYNVWNVGCGYGMPDGGGFYANPIYAENNPCLVDGKIIVPEGFIGFKLPYGNYLDSLYYAISNGEVTHSKLDKDGYSALAHNWNSLDNIYIANDVRVFVREDSLDIFLGANSNLI